MRYLSVCSGIEAASVAWEPIGFSPLAFSEINKFPSAVLAHHYPEIPNYGDLTKFQTWPDLAPDILVGGTPCQSFSVAGNRGGLDDPRGQLMWAYLGLALQTRPRWIVWENVPGVLSSGKGRDFGAFLGALGEIGYGWAYRVLDAQYFGLAQRRKRVFVVGYLGDWRRAAAVLFERESLSGHPAPRREAGQIAPTVPSRRAAGGGLGTDFDCDGGLIPEIAPTLRAGGNQTGGDRPPGTDVDTCESLIPITLAIRGRGDSHDLEYRQDGIANAILTPNGGRCGIGVEAVAFDWQSGGDSRGLDPKDTAQLQRCQVPAMHFGMQVRRLIPRECERLQGFPDDYTLIPYRGKLAADGPRYKALGNSMAVPVVRWIGRRIQIVDALSAMKQAA